MESDVSDFSDFSDGDGGFEGPSRIKKTAPPPGADPESPETNDDSEVYRSLLVYPWATDADYQAGLAAIFGHPDRSTSNEELEEKKDLVLQAQCFYFSRKYNIPPIKWAEYKTWLVLAKPEMFHEDEMEITAVHPDTGDTTPAAALAALEGNVRPVSQGEIKHKDFEKLDDPSASVEIAAAATSGPMSAAHSVSSEPHSQAPSKAKPEQPPYPTSFADIVELITNNKPIPGIEQIPDTVLELGSSKADKTTRRLKPWEKAGTTAVATTTATVEEALPASSAAPAPTSPDTVTTAGTSGPGIQEVAEGKAEAATSIKAEAKVGVEADAEAGAGAEPPQDTKDDITREGQEDDGDQEKAKSLEKLASRPLHRPRGQGVMHILQPDAVPDSGLVAKE